MLFISALGVFGVPALSAVEETEFQTPTANDVQFLVNVHVVFFFYRPKKKNNLSRLEIRFTSILSLDF